MSNAIKQQHDAFAVYGHYNDWGFAEAIPAVDISVSNGYERGRVTLSLEEAAQAIDLIKNAIKQAEKETKRIAKRHAKNGGAQRF